MDLDDPGYGNHDHGRNATSLDYKMTSNYLDPVFYEADEEEICWLCTPGAAHYFQDCPYRVAKDAIGPIEDPPWMIDQAQDQPMMSDSSGTADSDSDMLLSSGEETIPTSCSESSLPDVENPQNSVMVKRVNSGYSFQYSPTSQDARAGSFGPLQDQHGKTEEVTSTANGDANSALTLRQIRRLEAEKALFESENCFPADEELVHIAALAGLSVQCLHIWFLEHLDVQCILTASAVAESPDMLTPRPVCGPPSPAPIVPALHSPQTVAEAAQKYINSSLEKSCASGQTRRAANATNTTACHISCPECPASFKNNNRWLRHMSKRYPQTLWYCYSCATEGGEPYIHHRNDKFLEHLLQHHHLAHADALKERKTCLVPSEWYQTAFPAYCSFVKSCHVTFQSWDEFQGHWRSHFSDKRSAIGPGFDHSGNDDDSNDDDYDDGNNDHAAKDRGNRSRPRRPVQSNDAANSKSTRTDGLHSKTTGRTRNNDTGQKSMSADSRCEDPRPPGKAEKVMRWLDTVDSPSLAVQVGSHQRDSCLKGPKFNMYLATMLRKLRPGGYHFRRYRGSGEVDQVYESARATSAAPTYFKSLGQEGLDHTFMDGGIDQKESVQNEISGRCAPLAKAVGPIQRSMEQISEQELSLPKIRNELSSEVSERPQCKVVTQRWLFQESPGQSPAGTGLPTREMLMCPATVDLLQSTCSPSSGRMQESAPPSLTRLLGPETTISRPKNNNTLCMSGEYIPPRPLTVPRSIASEVPDSFDSSAQRYRSSHPQYNSLSGANVARFFMFRDFSMASSPMSHLELFYLLARRSISNSPLSLASFTSQEIYPAIIKQLLEPAGLHDQSSIIASELLPPYLNNTPFNTFIQMILQMMNRILPHFDFGDCSAFSIRDNADFKKNCYLYRKARHGLQFGSSSIEYIVFRYLLNRPEEARDRRLHFIYFLTNGIRQQASLKLISSELQSSRSQSKSALYHGALGLPISGVESESGARDENAEDADERVIVLS